MVRQEPVRVFAHKERNGRNARRNYPPPVLTASLIACHGVESRRMRRQAPPPDRASQTQVIEVGGIIVRDSARQNKSFPGACRYFESLQLTDYFERPMSAAHLRARSDMLPAQKPVHELRRRDWSDLLAQGRNCQPVNARQQTPLAPFGLRDYLAMAALGRPGKRSESVSRLPNRSKSAGQNRTRSLHA